MKNVLTLFFGLLIVFSVEAQKQKKPNINKAKTLWTQGKLDEAKTMIDAATEFEKTMNDGKTWYYRGLIYATIDTTSNPDFQSLVENPRDVAMSSFDKASELADEGKGYFVYEPGGAIPVTMDQQINTYHTYYFTIAVENYENKEMVKASENFEISWKIMPADTAAIVNAGYAALAADNSSRAYAMFENAVESGATDITIYYSMINILNDSEDWQGSLDLIRKAKDLYPSDNSLNRFEVTSLIKLEKVEEAKAQLIESINNEPTDPILRFSLALLYEETNDVDLAIGSYEAAIEVDPNHYASNFNLAVMKFNSANAIYKEWTQLTTSSADQKKDKELKPKIQKGFEEVLIIWEKVYSIKKPDEPTLQTLMFLYSYLNNNEKADQMEEELNALE